MKEQPKALFLADALENGECFVVDRNGNDVYGWMYEDPTAEAADELRRLHNENQRLREALKWARDVDCGCCSGLQEIPYLFRDLIEWADNINEAAKQRAAAIRARGKA